MASKPRPEQPATYWDYVRVKELIELQHGLEDESSLAQDEVVFIIVHQVYELWFKLMIRDLRAARDLFAQEVVPDDRLAGARRLLDRIRIILELANDHFPLVETITSRDFLSFRDKLFPANGGQSPQFRQVEILLGLEESQRIPYATGGSYRDILREADGSEGWAAQQITNTLADTPTLKQAVDGWLYRTPINGSSPAANDDEEVVVAFVEDYLSKHNSNARELAERVCRIMKLPDDDAKALRDRYEAENDMAKQFLRAEDVDDTSARPRRRRIRAAALFIETYRELPLLAWPREIVEGLVAVEQAFVTYRQRHARMAERVIGRRIGTGGSSGVEYLDECALRYRIFRDLWGVRTLLVRRDRLSDPAAPEFYGFRFAKD